MEFLNAILNDWLVVLVVSLILIWLISVTARPENCKWATSCILIAYFGFLIAYFVFAYWFLSSTLEVLEKFLRGLGGA